MVCYDADCPSRIKVPVKPHRGFPDGKLCESKIVRRGERYIAMLTFEFPAPPVRLG